MDATSSVPPATQAPHTTPTTPHRHSTVFFLVALLLLLVLTQSHQPRPLVLVAWAVYVLAAGNWVREQYVDGLDGRATPPLRLQAVATACVGALLVSVGVLLRGHASWGEVSSWAVVTGALALYLGVGWFVASRRRLSVGAPLTWRGPAARATRLRLLALALLACATVAGLVLLGRAPLPVAAGLVALGLGLLPAFLSPVSELGIRWAMERDGRTSPWIWASCWFVALLVMAWVGFHSGWLASAGLVLVAALLVAIASSTLADIAVVLAVIVLIGMTPPQDAADRPLPAPRGHGLLVAFGDSYMSGEGAAVFVDGTDQGGGNECRRADTAWPVLSGRQAPFGQMVSFACSGAVTRNVRHVRDDALSPMPEPMPGVGMTQLDEYDAWVQRSGGPVTPDLVVLSIGGNDAGFSSVGITCLAPGSCDTDEPRRLWSDSNLDRMQNRLRQTYAELDATFPDTPVAVIPYTDPLGPRSPCSQTLLGAGDVAFLKKFVAEINARVRATAAEYGFHYVAEVEQALRVRGLQLCDEDARHRPGLNFIGLRSVGGLSEQRFNPAKWVHNSLHPNERGHTAVHEAFQRWLASQGDAGLPRTSLQLSGALPVRVAGGTPGIPRAERPVPGSSDCSRHPDDAPENCRAQSTRWALRQVGSWMAFPVAPLVTVVGGLAWVGALFLFGWRRSVNLRRGTTGG